MSTSRLTTPASVSVCLSAHLHLAATYISIIICHVISLLRTTVHLYASFYARDGALVAPPPSLYALAAETSVLPDLITRRGESDRRVTRLRPGPPLIDIDS